MSVLEIVSVFLLIVSLSVCQLKTNEVLFCFHTSLQLVNQSLKILPVKERSEALNRRFMTRVCLELN